MIQRSISTSCMTHLNKFPCIYWQHWFWPLLVLPKHFETLSENVNFSLELRSHSILHQMTGLNFIGLLSSVWQNDIWDKTEIKSWEVSHLYCLFYERATSFDFSLFFLCGIFHTFPEMWNVIKMAILFAIYTYLTYMSRVYLGNNFDIVTFLKKSSYWETQKCQMPRTEHCMPTASASYRVLLCIITCLCSIYVFVYPLGLFPFRHVVPISPFVPWVPPSLSLSLFLAVRPPYCSFGHPSNLPFVSWNKWMLEGHYHLQCIVNENKTILLPSLDISACRKMWFLHHKAGQVPEVW